MKLIFCSKCHDIVKLGFKHRACLCGKSWGMYKDRLNAIVGGDAVPLGILNSDFAEAIRQRPEFGDGARFTAFVIPEISGTITYCDDL